LSTFTVYAALATATTSSSSINTTYNVGNLYGRLYLNTGGIKEVSNYRDFLYKKSLDGKYWRKKFENFNKVLVDFQRSI
jgi:hypothetical protein